MSASRTVIITDTSPLITLALGDALAAAKGRNVERQRRMHAADRDAIWNR